MAGKGSNSDVSLLPQCQSLFPDAAHTSSQSSKRAAPTEAEEPSDLRLKACPTDSLTAHLGMILCELSQTDDGVSPLPPPLTLC